MPPVRQLVKRFLPARALNAYRRRRALRNYLRGLSYEVYDRGRIYELEELEGELLARRPDLTDRLIKDLLQRTDVLVQQLDRRIEGLRARHGNELRELRREIESLRASIEALSAAIPGKTAASGTPARES